MAADHRSAHPNIAGLPWWGAVLVAVTATAIGFAFDAGSGQRELGFAFAACYAIGCVLAVLAVRQDGLFTAVIQPPLILFVSVPGSYFLFHSGQLDGIKDLLINCGYPLIERFPLMFFTSAVVLLIGVARWYYGMSAKRATPNSDGGSAGRVARAGFLAAATAKVSALVARPARRPTDDDEALADDAPRRRHSADRPRRTARPAPGEATRTARRPAAQRSAASRSRHARPPETEIIEPVADRPRRPRSARSAEPPAEPRRRSRSQAPRERTQPPADRRSPYEPYEPYERPERRRRYDDRAEARYQDRYGDYTGDDSGYEGDYGPPEPRRADGGGTTHHPISRVRYRSDDAGDGADRGGHRTAPRARRRDAGAWEYDV